MQTEGAWNEGGKGMSVYDIRQPAEFASDWKVATDSYHRYRAFARKATVSSMKKVSPFITSLSMNCLPAALSR